MNLAKLIDEKAPMVIPMGWRRAPNIPDGAIWTRSISGLTIMYSLSTIEGGHKYHHISFSRIDQLPSWEEMRDALYNLPWLDKEREIFMTLPPKKDYVSGCGNPYVLHWWQEF